MNSQHMGGAGHAALAAFGLKVLGAIVAWIVGRYLIHLALRLIGVGLTRQQVDATLQRYIRDAFASASGFRSRFSIFQIPRRF